MGRARRWPAAKECVEAVDGIADIDRLIVIAIEGQ
jgi:hypothetical protein